MRLCIIPSSNKENKLFFNGFEIKIKNCEKFLKEVHQ